MRWFKHYVDARRDERLTKLFDIHRHRGVLMYWWILEILAEQMDESDRHHASHTIGHWAKMLGTYAKDLEKITTSLADLQLIFTTSSGDLLTISCPKLLEIRARRKPIVGRIGRLDKDKDIDKEKEKREPKKVSVSFDPFWGKFEGRNGLKGSKKKALEYWNKMTKEEQELAMEAIQKQVKNYSTCKANNVFVAEFPDAWRWLRDRRWEDDLLDLSGPKQAPKPPPTEYDLEWERRYEAAQQKKRT